jgi:hypothetical protein
MAEARVQGKENLSDLANRSFLGPLAARRASEGVHPSALCESGPHEVKSAVMNDYDKAGRYLIKRDSGGFFRWFFDNPLVTFQTWMDARLVALPDQKDLTNDLVAALATVAGTEAICLELEAEAKADALTRLLAYLARLWTEPGGVHSLPVNCVSGAVLDLTGRSPTSELKLQSAIAPGCRLELSVMRRQLADEDATHLVNAVTAGEVSPWQLVWVPLMQGGTEPAIIVRWRDEATRLMAEERDRADLGSLALPFATLAGCWPVWEKALRGWNMQTSPFLDEIRAQGREEGRAEGERSMLLHLGRQKFGKTPSKKQQKVLDAIDDLTQLKALAERLLAVDSWADLLAEG